MSANVTTPVMVTIDSNGNYQAVKIAAPGSAAPSTATINQIAGINTNGNIIQYVNVSDSGTPEGSDVAALIVDEYKSFNIWKNYSYNDVSKTAYNASVTDAIQDWNATYGAGYDEIIISVLINGIGANNTQIYITIIKKA